MNIRKLCYNGEHVKVMTVCLFHHWYKEVVFNPNIVIFPSNILNVFLFHIMLCIFIYFFNIIVVSSLLYVYFQLYLYPSKNKLYLILPPQPPLPPSHIPHPIWRTHAYCICFVFVTSIKYVGFLFSYFMCDFSFCFQNIYLHSSRKIYVFLDTVNL